MYHRQTRTGRTGAPVRRAILGAGIGLSLGLAAFSCALPGAARGEDLSAQTIHIDPASSNTGTLTNGLTFGGPITVTYPSIDRKPSLKGTLPTGTGISSNRASGNVYGLDFFTSFLGLPSIRMSITSAGRVGIGTTAPTKAVEIDAPGSVELGLKSTDANGTLWTLQSTGVVQGANAALNSTFQIVDRTLGLKRFEIDKTGMVSVDVLKINGGSDIAEPFDSGARLEAGSVVVIDETSPGRLKLSQHAYDRKVAGVVSGAGGIGMGLTLVQLRSDRPQSPVALSGRVFAMADTLGGPIAPGDFLTTSSVPGHAMKASNLRRARGATLGKAMTALKSGDGLVLVLVGLQ